MVLQWSSISSKPVVPDLTFFRNFFCTPHMSYSVISMDVLSSNVPLRLSESQNPEWIIPALVKRIDATSKRADRKRRGRGLKIHIGTCVFGVMQHAIHRQSWAIAFNSHPSKVRKKERKGERTKSNKHFPYQQQSCRTINRRDRSSQQMFQRFFFSDHFSQNKVKKRKVWV